MPISAQKFADRTREIRFTIYALTQRGYSDKDALLKAMPTDANRRTRLKAWSKTGLWPVRDIERQNYPNLLTECEAAVDKILSGGPEPNHISEQADLLDVPASGDFMIHVMAQVKTLVKEEVARAISEILSKGQIMQETPPEPIRKEGGRAFLVRRVKIAGTTDSTLMNLFEKERKRRNLSVSRMIDTVLWNYFGKPKLSFERSDEKEENT